MTRAAPPTLRDPWLLALVAVAAAARAVGLDAQLWFDEIWMVVDYVRKPFGEPLVWYPADNNHPLYGVLAWISAHLFGESGWSVRLPAAVLGVLCVPAIDALARPRLGRRTALTAAAVTALAAPLVDYSQNARGYTGALLLTLVSSHLLLRALATGRARHWIGQGLALAAGVGCHLTVAVVGAGHLAVVVLAARRAGGGHPRAGLLGLATGAAGALLLHAGLLGQMARSLLADGRPEAPAAAAWTDPAWLAAELARSLGMGLVPGLAVLGAAAGLGIVGVVSLVRRFPALLLLGFLPGVALAVLFLALGRNLWPRLFFALSGFALLVGLEGLFAAARGVARRVRAPPGRVATAAALLVVLASAATLPRTWALPKQDYLGALRHVRGAARSGEPVVTVGLAGFPYREYHHSGFAHAEDVAALEELFPPGRTGFVVYTFPIHLRSRHPGVWSWLVRSGREAVRFPGTVGGGDVVVVRIE